MAKSTRSLIPALLGLTLAACGGGGGNPLTPDGSVSDARLPDGATAQCRGDVECDDGLFCNGAETCDPANAAADTRGCLLGGLVDCDDGVDCTADSCDEDRRACRHDAPDNDGDGHAAVTCVDSAGVALGDDCDDNDANRFPGNVEVCNAGDEDCNPETLGFLDGDGDGASSSACSNPQPDGSTLRGPDCNDDDTAIRPGAPDGPMLGCDNIDNDCDGTIDVGCPCTSGTVVDCGAPEELMMIGECRPGSQTCIDGSLTEVCSGATHATEEFCDGRDNDCDGEIDEGVMNTYYPDTDGDGFGDPAGAPAMACSPPMGFVRDSSDCDDTSSATHPGASEICDAASGGTSADENCDGTVNEGCACTAGETQSCGPASDAGECAFGTQRCVAGVWGACEGAVLSEAESCNGRDDDCDGSVDNGVLNTYYRDTDGDGFGDAAMTRTGCSPPAGYVTNSTDCEVDAAQAHPGGTEVCDGSLDEDCDGSVDEGCGCTDGATQSCGPSSATGVCVIGTQRCAGGVWATCEGAVNPSPESCNGADDDCDGMVDEGVKTTFYADTDGDGFGTNVGTGTAACAQPAGFVANHTDCADGNAAWHPGALEVCEGSTDENCNGSIDEGCSCTDGMARACGMTSVGACVDGTQICISGTWSSCAAFVPPVTEACNGIDDDCDGTIDNGFTCRQGQTRGCTTSHGVAGGTQSCLADCGGWTACSHAEVCNGFDDDLDGVADETFACVKGGFASCTNSCGELTSFGACTDACAIPAPATCFLPSEVCNYCDDDGDAGTSDETLALGSVSENPTSCGSDFRVSGTASCSLFFPPTKAVVLVSGQLNRAGAAWLSSPRYLGWGPMSVHATVRARTVGGASPADAWTIILADHAAGGSDLGALGSGHGVPLNRRGLSIEWDFYDHGTSRPDRITVYRLHGDGTAKTALAFANVDIASMRLDSGSPTRFQEMYIVYTPDDPATFGSEERLTVQTSLSRAPIIDIDAIVDPGTVCLPPCVLNILTDDLTAGTEVDIGFTTGTGGLTSRLDLYLYEPAGATPYTTDVTRQRVCF